jgi:hypothetical protein
MRKLLIIGAAVLMLASASIAVAATLNLSSVSSIYFSDGTSAYLPETVASGLGVNYGHYTVTNSSFAPGGTVPIDYAHLQAAGVKYVRIVLQYSDDYSGATSTDLDLATTSAETYGFTTTYGFAKPDLSLSPYSSSTIATYMTQVLALEPYIQAGGIQDFTMGNEIEEDLNTSSISIAQFEYDIQELACEVKAEGYTGTVSYQAQQGDIANWHANYQLGTSCLDYIGFNIYSNFGIEAALIVSDFGSHGYISEWNPSSNGSSSYSSEQAYGTATWNAQHQLVTSGISRFYFFTYRTDNVYQTGALDEFGLYTETGEHPYVGSVLAL